MCLSETAAISGHADPRVRSVRLGINRFVPTYPAARLRPPKAGRGSPARLRRGGRPSARTSAPGRCHPDRAHHRDQRVEHADEVEAVVAPVLAVRSTGHWVRAGQTRRVPITAMVSTWEPRSSRTGRSAAVRARRGVRAQGQTLPFQLGHDGMRLPWWHDDEATAPWPGARRRLQHVPGGSAHHPYAGRAGRRRRQGRVADPSGLVARLGG